MLGQVAYTSYSSRQSPSKSVSKKQYSYEEMKRWCQELLDLKTSQLMREVNENNEVIKILSEKIKSLQHQLDGKQKVVVTHAPQHNHSKDQLITITNSLLNSKLRDVQEDVDRKLGDLETNKQHLVKMVARKQVEGYQVRMEDEITGKIQNIKVMVKDRLEHTQKGNTEYWGKVKSWLKGLEGKFNSCVDISVGIQKNMEESDDMISRSLLNVYKLRNFNTRIKQMEVALYDLEESFKNITEYQNEHRVLVENRGREVELPYVPETRWKQNLETESVMEDNLSRVNEKVQERLSPLQNNFSEREDSRIIPYTSFCSNTTAKRQVLVAGVGDVEKRLTTMSRSKGLELPLSCYRDQFGYLKNSLNNYIFDLEGNMLKPSLEEFHLLVEHNVIRSL